jgi:hypothetical protein
MGLNVGPPFGVGAKPVDPRSIGMILSGQAWGVVPILGRLVVGDYFSYRRAGLRAVYLLRLSQVRKQRQAGHQK